MKNYPLNVEAPKSFSYVKRNIPNVTVEQRERRSNPPTTMNLHFRRAC